MMEGAMCKNGDEIFQVSVRMYEELNDFLPVHRRKQEFQVEFPERRSVKDLIESTGVPHVEVDMILVNGEPVDFDYILRHNDRISVYPVFERFDVSGMTPRWQGPLRDPRFVCDVHLRPLARYLRLLGFDTDYSPERDDPELADVSHRERRVLLTRDRGLLMRRIVDRGLYVRNRDPDKQLREIMERLQFRNCIDPFSRCMECNGIIERMETEKALERVPPGVASWCREFFRCRECGKIYWKGSHYEKLLERVKSLS